jgi:hypothetical protein
MSLYGQTCTKNQWKCYIAWISRFSSDTIRVCTGTCTFLIWKTRLVVPTTNIDIFDAINQVNCPGKVTYTFCWDMN